MASGKKRTRRNPAGNPGTRVNRPVPAAMETPVAQSNLQSSPAPTSGSPDTPTRRSDAVDWNNEYSYVIGDLKQMAVVTVSLFAVMIAIGFII
ncbi:MAG: hypothetical protein WDZ49_01990 [Litorilinea sp.]